MQCPWTSWSQIHLCPRTINFFVESARNSGKMHLLSALWSFTEESRSLCFHFNPLLTLAANSPKSERPSASRTNTPRLLLIFDNSFVTKTHPKHSQTSAIFRVLWTKNTSVTHGWPTRFSLRDWGKPGIILREENVTVFSVSLSVDWPKACNRLQRFYRKAVHMTWGFFLSEGIDCFLVLWGASREVVYQIRAVIRHVTTGRGPGKLGCAQVFLEQRESLS